MKNKITRTVASVYMCLLLGPVMADEQFATTPVEKLGDERYRIGAITVDRSSSSFSVPGKIIHLTDALEYLAVSSNGMKEYESLLELTTLPGDFNLACILVGLDDENSVKPRFQFDEEKAEGQRVAISLSWDNDGETETLSGANALQVGDDAFDDNHWVYIGSATGNYGKEFMADAGGTLISFVHDPYSIIDHRNGAGIGNYGLVTANVEVLPPIGTAITLTITVLAE
jgi:hypothetical protein